jgi:hypothetical protein
MLEKKSGCYGKTGDRSDMKVITELEAERVLQLMSWGYSQDEIVSRIIMGRNIDLSCEVAGDVHEIYAYFEEKGRKAREARGIWSVLKKKS